MSYLLDKKIKRKKFLHIASIVFVCLVLFYFRSGIWNSLSYGSHKILRPVLIVGDGIGGKWDSIKFYFLSKGSLYAENENLKSKLSESEARMANYNSVLSENMSLKEILGRSGGTGVVLSAILSKPNRSLYDSLVIDAGVAQGLQIGDTVFALGNVPVGRISDVYSNSSKVVLFSSAGVRTQVTVGDGGVFMEAVGRGGGNFEMIIPRDLALLQGDRVLLPGLNPFVLAEVVTIISDPRDPFVKALLVSAVNIQELKFVQVERKQ